MIAQQTSPVLWPIDPMLDCSTFTQCLQLRMAQRPNALAYRYLDEGEVSGPITIWTWADVALRSGRVAAAVAKVAAPGDRAILLFAPGLEFIAAFFGCLRAGVIPVPVPPPDPTRLLATLPRLLGIFADARPACVLTTNFISFMAQGIGGDVAGLPWFCVEELGDGPIPEYTARPEDVAFLQYTSGSTGEPKGVRVTQRSLLANLRMIGRGFHIDRPGRIGQGVSWLPFYHDMGLIGIVLAPVYLGSASTLFSPLDFLKRPARWLEAISHFGVDTMSGAPDFAYAFAARRTEPEVKKRLDLSKWAYAFCGAEPVRPETLHAFAETFAECGFSPQSFCPAYGLAEATLFVSAKRIEGAPVFHGVDPVSLQHGHAKPGSKILVSCGASNSDGRVRIVTSGGTTPLVDGAVGEIVVAGSHVADGYWDKPEDPSFNVFLDDGDGPFLRTGDLGFILDGELYISGRAKDLIIVRGRNIHPHDLETTADSIHPAIRAGGLAAFGIDRDGEERVAMVCEIDPKQRAVGGDVVAAIRDCIGKAHGVEVETVILVPPRTILRTTSGKIRRSACRDAWRKGEFEVFSEERLAPAPPPASASAPAHKTAPELLAWMTAWIQERVRPGRVRPNDSFTSLGLDSLNLIWLSADLEKLLGFEVPVQTLYGGTLKTTAALLAMGQRRIAPNKPRDLENDAILDPAIMPAVRPEKRGADAPLLLTGATGFLGTYLLHALLRRTRAPIVCLVRGASEAIAKQRLVDAAAALELGALDLERVHVVTGDLSKPKLGLSDETWSELVSSIGAVYHCGAEIDWIKPYSSLKDVNLGGTREIVRLACEAFVPAHYVSTVGVFPLAEDAQLPFPEDADVADGDKLQLGYSQSKWAAERLLEHARARGLEVTVYRPSFIAGDSRTGAETRSEHQLFYAFQAGCIQMGKVPAAEKVIDAVSVDWVADAVVALSLDPRARNKRLNLINPQPIRQRVWYEILRKCGFNLQEVAYPRWRDEVLALGPDNPLSRFAVYYKLMDEHRMARLEVQMAEKLPLDDTLARRLLDELNLRCPPLDERLLKVYLAYYQSRGLLPTPASAMKPAETGAREMPDRHIFHVDHLPAPLERNDETLWNFYERGKDKQWNASSRIDWTVPFDPENPLETPDVGLPLFGSDVYTKMTAREQAAVRRHYQAWQISQFLHGEQLGVVAAARLVQLAPSIEFQLFAASQTMDEARHVEIYSRLLNEKLELSYPMVEPFARLANSAMNDRRWDIIALGLQILVEGLALASFATFREQSRNSLIKKVHAYVMEDEARHVAFGQKALSKYYAQLTDSERNEREEFLIEASYMLRDRIMAVDAVWENVGLPVETCSRWVRESGFQRAWSSSLFSRVIPAIRAIGLWSPKVQKAYAQMGILGFSGVNLDELVAQDEARAEQLEENHGS